MNVAQTIHKLTGFSNILDSHKRKVSTFYSSMTYHEHASIPMNLEYLHL